MLGIGLAEPWEFEMAVAGATVTVAYYLQNKAALDAAGPISIVDGAAHIAAHLDELNTDPEVTSISLGTPGAVLTLNLTQALKDTHALAALANPNIAVVSSAGDIEALTTSQIQQLSAFGVTQLKATDQDVELTSAQKQALGLAKVAIVQPYSGGGLEVLRYQPSGLPTSVSYRGIVGQPFTDYSISYGSDGKPTSASFSNGLTKSWAYNADGSYSIAYAGVMGQNYTSYTVDYGTDGKAVSASYSNGMTASWTYLANGSYDVLYGQVTGEAYSDYEMHYGSDGKPITAFYSNGMMATWTYDPDGAHSIAYEGVTGQPYTSYTVDYGTDGKPTSAAYSNGMTATWTYNGDGTSHIDYSNVIGAAFTAYSLTDDANGRPTTATYNNGMTASWTYLSNGSHDVLYANVTGQPYPAYETHYGSDGRPTTAFYSNGMTASWTYQADGSYAAHYNGVTGASYTSDTISYGQDGRPESATYNNGMTSTWTYADDGARVVAYQGMNGSAGYTSHAAVINALSQTTADAEDINDSSGIFRIYGSNMTISSSANGLGVTTGEGDSFDLTAHANETMAVKQANSERFDFSSGFGADSISGLQIGGAGGDVIQFDVSMFSGLSSTNTAAQNLANLLSSGAVRQSGDNVTITDLADDVLTLKGVTTTALSASANSFFKFL